MIVKKCCGVHALRIAVRMTMLALLLAGSANAEVVGSIEIRGEVTEGPFLWDAYNFPAFFYDFQGDVKTETLNILYINGRIIPPGQLIYSTSPEEVTFNYSNFGKYKAIGFMADKYFAGYTANTSYAKTRPSTDFDGFSALSQGELHKVLIDDDTKHAISVGRTLELKDGYVLKAEDIDLKGKSLFLSLLKDGNEVDALILSTNETYVYSKNVSGIENLPLIMVRFDNVSVQGWHGAILKGIFQISDNPTSVKTTEEFGKMKVTYVSQNGIVMKNSADIGLNKGTTTDIMGNIWLKVADNDALRFYPMVTYTQPGTYEVRGTIADAGASGSVMPSWNAQSFTGFFYDLKNNRSTESMDIRETLDDLNANRTIPEKTLFYNTGKAMVEFKVHETEGLNVINTSEFYKDKYPVVGWRGEKWIAVKGNANKLTKLAFEMGKEDKKTLTLGETWSLGSGYELTLNAVDARASPRLALFSLKKDGALIDDGMTSEGNVYYMTQTIMGESDSLLFAVYVDSIFPDATSDMVVQFKYAWLIDQNSAKEITASDEYGVFEVIQANTDIIVLYNKNSISLSKNMETILMGDLKFKMADNDTMRFYPKIDYVISDGKIPPTGIVHNINKGVNYTTIQDAIDDASFGDEIRVDSGTYYENVNVTKRLILRGIGNPVVDAGGSGNAIMLSANGITLEGFTETGAGDYPEAGIKVTSSSNTLTGNNVSNNWNGIYLSSSSNNTMNGNNASNNSHGIYLDSSSNNTLSGNNASNNGGGIYLSSSSNNTLIGNNASNNGNGYGEDYGIYLSSSNNNTLIGNNASNKGNRYGEDYGVYLDSSSPSLTGK